MAKKLSVLVDNKPGYDIIFTYNFDDIGNLIKSLNGRKYDKICIVSDSNVFPIYGGELVSKLSNYFNLVITHIFEAGEKNKQLSSVEKLYEKLIEAKFTRSDLLIALGGGVVGDMTGFAAATYLRGIDFIQVPTSLLAMVDSSIGGKTAVDLWGFKNMVGAFHMPRLVFINTEVLKTLPDEQFSCGMGEVLKHGLIRDQKYFADLVSNVARIRGSEASEEYISDMIYRSCEIKKAVVEADPTEKGERAVLNFGHTIGHAIEKLSDFSLFHGHCVALGSVAASHISLKRGYINESDLEAIKSGFTAYGLPISLGEHEFSHEDVLITTKSDKKMTASGIKFILLHSVGDAYIDETVTDDEILEGIGALCE